MATTARPITELVNGIRDTSGAVVAGGKARFYQPGTLISRSVFSDDVCTAAISQPLTLNAGGQYNPAYVLEPTRMIVKDSTETTTYYDGIVNLNRHDAVYITHPDINGGAETTLEEVIGLLATASGTGNFQYKESSGATARNWPDVIGEHWVSVSDFGAVGDNSNDDTAEIQAAIDRVAARSGGVVLFPEGNYRITAPLVISTPGITLRGVGYAESIITNAGTTTNAVTVNVSASADSRCAIENLSISAATSSTGAGIGITDGDGTKIDRCSLAGHATGIACSTMNGTIVQNSYVTGSTQGFNLGPRSKVAHCEVVQGADTGTGVLVTGTDCRVHDVYVSDCAVGIWVVGVRAVISDCNLSSVGTTGIFLDLGANSIVKGCHIVGTTTTGINDTSSAAECVISDCMVTGCTTGITVNGARSKASNCVVGTSTTGFSMNAANARLIGCVTTGGTTGISCGTAASMTVKDCHSNATTALSVGAATLFVERDNEFTGTYTNAATSTRDQRTRSDVEITTSSTTPVTFNPDITTGQIQFFHGSHAAAAQVVTIAAHSTATVAVGDTIRFVFAKTGANQMTLTWNAQYVDADGSAMTAAAVATASVRTFEFLWTGSVFRSTLISSDVGI